MIKTEALVFVIALMLTLAGCSTSLYQLAFVSRQNGNYDLFIVNSDSSNLRRLTNTPVHEYNLVWSADGKKLYYTVYHKSIRQINSFDLAANKESVVLLDSNVQSIADISNDNKFLLIASSDDHPKGELYLYDIERRSKTRITQNQWVESGAKFSPDMKFIVTGIQTAIIDSVNHKSVSEIFMINLKDFTSTQLTSLEGFCALPSFSPDGNTIAFHRCADSCEVLLVNIDGSDVRRLNGNAADCRWPRWTPDGKWIAFTRTVDKNSDIYFISPDGKSLMPVITNPGNDEIAEIRPGKNKNRRQPH